MTPDELINRRKGMDHTQASLAAALGVDERTVRKWETGERSCPPILDLAMRALEYEARLRRVGERTA
jgi:DNA-binding transcriptional regulator YiaG